MAEKRGNASLVDLGTSMHKKVTPIHPHLEPSCMVQHSCIEFVKGFSLVCASEGSAAVDAAVAIDSIFDLFAALFFPHSLKCKGHCT